MAPAGSSLIMEWNIVLASEKARRLGLFRAVDTILDWERVFDEASEAGLDVGMSISLRNIARVQMFRMNLDILRPISYTLLQKYKYI